MRQEREWPGGGYNTADSTRFRTKNLKFGPCLPLGTPLLKRQTHY